MNFGRGWNKCCHLISNRLPRYLASVPLLLMPSKGRNIRCSFQFYVTLCRFSSFQYEKLRKTFLFDRFAEVILNVLSAITCWTFGASLNKYQSNLVKSGIADRCYHLVIIIHLFSQVGSNYVSAGCSTSKSFLPWGQGPPIQHNVSLDPTSVSAI